MTTKKNISIPWDFIIDKIFKEYWSKDFYKQFKSGWYRISPEINKRWCDEYMGNVGIVPMVEFFEKIYEWKPSYEKKFKDIDYDTLIAYLMPICAPTFFEQTNSHLI